MIVTTSAALVGATAPPAYDVFLSYHRGDREATQVIRGWLEAHEVRTFMDVELEAGLPWVKSLEGALQ